MPTFIVPVVIALHISLKIVFFVLVKAFKWVETIRNGFLKKAKYTPQNYLFNEVKTDDLMQIL